MIRGKIPAESRQQERPNRCPQAGRTSADRASLTGLPRGERHTNSEGTGPQLSGGHAGSHAGDESPEGSVSKLGDSLCWPASVRTTPSAGMAGARSPKPACAAERNSTISNSMRCRLCASKCGVICWPRAGSTGHEVAAPDSFDRPDPSGSADRSDSDATSLSHQAATLGLQRFGFEDLRQRRIPFCRGATPAIQKAPGHSRAQHQSQSRSEKYLQGCGHPSCWRTAGRFRSSTPL